MGRIRKIRDTMKLSNLLLPLAVFSGANGEGSGDGTDLLTILFKLKILIKTLIDLSKSGNQRSLLAELNDGDAIFKNLVFRKLGDRKKRSADDGDTWEIIGDASYSAETDLTADEFLTEAKENIEAEVTDSGGLSVEFTEEEEVESLSCTDGANGG